MRASSLAMRASPTELDQAIRSAIAAPREADRTIADGLGHARPDAEGESALRLVGHQARRGGLIDIEFIAQTLLIVHSAAYPDILHRSTLPALARLAEHGLIDAADARILEHAGALYQRLTQILRLCVSGTYVPATAPAGLNRLVSNACSVPDIASAEALLAETQADVAGLFARLVGPLA